MSLLHKYTGLIAVIVSFGVASPSYAQSAAAIKGAECQAIANLFEQSGGSNFQNTGNLPASTSLVDRLLVGMKGLQLRDPKLRGLQARYIEYFGSASQMLKTASSNQTTGNNSALEAMLPLAKANSGVGSQLSLELVEYCLQ